MKVFIRRALGIAAFAAAGLFAASSAHAQCTNTCSTSFDVMHVFVQSVPPVFVVAPPPRGPQSLQSVPSEQME